MKYVFRLDGELLTAFVRRDLDSYKVEVNGRGLEVRPRGGGWAVDGSAVGLRLGNRSIEFEGTVIETALESIGRGESHDTHGEGEVRPPLPGKVVALRVKEGDEVKAGDTLVVLEAMKMQNEIASPCAGRVLSVGVKVGDAVDGETLLVRIG